MVKGVISKLAAGVMLVCLLTVSSAFAQSVISAPADGSTLGALPTFSWNKVAGADYYWVFVGSTLGGYQYYTTNMYADNTTIIPGLPSDGSTVYVRLWTHKPVEGYTYNDFSYTARSGGGTDLAEMTSPAANGSSILPRTTFQWENVGATSYWIYAGSTPGASDYGSKGLLAGQTSRTIEGLPVNTTVYVRLFTRFGRFQKYIDYNYNTGIAQMTYPANGAVLDKPAVFTWADDGADWYWLYIGNTVGGYQYYTSNQGLNLSATVPGLPSNSSTVNVRLWSRHGSNYAYNDYSYIANGTGTTDLAVMSAPAEDNATLNADNSSATATFTWTPAVATGATNYWLFVGATQGASNLYTNGQLTRNTVTLNRTTWPSVIWTRLFTRIGLFQKYVDNYYRNPYDAP